MKEVEFYFDFGSPAAYLAYTQLPKMCETAGAKLVWKPMLLGGVFQATGNKSPITVPIKGKYVFEDFKRYAKRYGVEFNDNPGFPINTLMLMRGAAGLQLDNDSRFGKYVDVMFRAIWIDAQDMNQPEVVGKVLHKAGFDPQAMLALAGEQRVKDHLKALTQEAVERGIFGAPTMFVSGQMYWGQDRLEWVKEALQ